jgi:hypothetical protein
MRGSGLYLKDIVALQGRKSSVRRVILEEVHHHQSRILSSRLIRPILHNPTLLRTFSGRCALRLFIINKNCCSSWYQAFISLVLGLARRERYARHMFKAGLENWSRHQILIQETNGSYLDGEADKS